MTVDSPTTEPASPSTGVDVSASTLVTGPDVSEWQGLVDWPKVAGAGHAFGIAKALEWVLVGSKRVPHVDARFARNWDGMRAAGLLRGAYLFFHPSVDPLAQAERFASTIGPLGPGDLMPLVDVEAHDGLKGPAIVAAVVACLERLETLTGRWPAIYTAEWFWRGWLANPKHWPGKVGADVLASWPLWIADYDVAKPGTLAWPSEMLWQHTGSGRCAGVTGKVDLNRFNGTRAELRGLAGIA